MESTHTIFTMTIVEVLPQQVERVNNLESEMKAKEQLAIKAELDLNVTKIALEKQEKKP